MMTAGIEVVGAGPAGLAAALTIAKRGGRAIVFEREADVGHRFRGDFEGLENWTTHGDVLEELTSLGAEPTFDHTPYSECVFYDPQGREHPCRSSQPLFYLVRRGPGGGTLDQALKEQALAAGVEFRFDTARKYLPGGGIVAHGPVRADAIAAGYVFETDSADGAYSAASERLAPKGYAYLLVCQGRGTIASCLFDDFHNERTYVERTVEFFRQKTGIRMKNPRFFGGFGNLFPLRNARKGDMLYAGEAAGFQDALFGFGMRYALLSGHYAARALLEGGAELYNPFWKKRLGGLMDLAMINRGIFERLGDFGYTRLVQSIGKAPDTRDWMRRYYGKLWPKKLLYPLVRRRLSGRANLLDCCRMDDCDCTLCRCSHGEQPFSERTPP